MAMTLVLAYLAWHGATAASAQGQQQAVQAQRPPAPPAAPGTVTFQHRHCQTEEQTQVFCNTVSDPTLPPRAKPAKARLHLDRNAAQQP